MRLSSNYLKMSFMHRLSFAAAIAAIWFPLVAFAGDADQELLNQLYREIVTSSAGKTVSNDTSIGKPSTGSTAALDRNNVMPDVLAADPATKRLQQEIDKMMNDIKTRHTEAVRFMQDTQ